MENPSNSYNDLLERGTKDKMTKKIFVVCSIFVTILSAVFITSIWINKEEKGNLVYVFDKSILNDYKIGAGLVSFNCTIVVKNNSDDKLHFSMHPDWSNEIGLVSEAYEQETISRFEKVHIIEPNAESSFAVNFTVPFGGNKTKKDRLPPKKIDFILYDYKILEKDADVLRKDLQEHTSPRFQ